MEHIIQEFDEQGYAILKGFFETSCVKAAWQECHVLVDQLTEKLCAENKSDERFADQPIETRLIHLYARYPNETLRTFRPELHLAGFFGLFAHPRLLEIATQILGPEIRLYPNYSVRPKLPEDKRTEVLWHQDAGYTSAQADILRMVNVWTPLVAVNEHNGCMQFVPGSHRQGVVPHEKEEHYLNISAAHIKPVEDRAIPLELDPGDVVIFSNLLFHRGLPNHSSHIRWSVDFRYQDATQSTLRQTQGHLLRSQIHPELVVKNAQHWSQLQFQ
jgi:phytanoyl-CoA hydroxylase